MALAGAESGSERKGMLKAGPEVVTGIRKLQKPDDEDNRCAYVMSFMNYVCN